MKIECLCKPDSEIEIVRELCASELLKREEGVECEPPDDDGGGIAGRFPELHGVTGKRNEWAAAPCSEWATD